MGKARHAPVPAVQTIRSLCVADLGQHSPGDPTYQTYQHVLTFDAVTLAFSCKNHSCTGDSV